MSTKIVANLQENRRKGYKTKIPPTHVIMTETAEEVSQVDKQIVDILDSQSPIKTEITDKPLLVNDELAVVVK